MNITQLRQAIAEDVFDYRQALGCLREYAKPRDKIGAWLRSGDIIRVKKGLYVFGDPYRREPVSREWLANLIYGPSYVSLDYALSYHGIIPERVETVTSVAAAQPRRFQTPLGLFTYRTLSPARYRIGFALIQSGRAGFLMATPEKALCDKIHFEKSFKPAVPEEVAMYLERELRVDGSRLKRLSKTRLSEIDRAYGTAKIHLVVKSLSDGRSRP